MDDKVITIRLNGEQAAELANLIHLDAESTGMQVDQSKVVKRLIHQEYNRRNDIVRIPAVEFTGKGDEIGKAFPAVRDAAGSDINPDAESHDWKEH